MNAIGQKDLKLCDVMSSAVCNLDNYECMMNVCHECPGREGVVNFLQSLPAMGEKEEIRYKKWVTVDRCTLQDVNENVEEFIESFSDAIMKLLRHHYVAIKQTKAFSKKKNNLRENEGVLVGDFAENHSFIVQDAAQGYHWDNTQCTLHPFVFYFKNSELELQHESYCFISDGMKHSTSMVYAFIKEIVPFIKSKHENLEKIIYFTDGCAGQYKNKSNFLNLYYHEEDFGIKAEWNFFATSHGKNACDGIGGTLKRCVTKASLQRLYENQILTPIDFYNYCKDQISNIRCFFVKKEDIEDVKKSLEARFETALPIPGTQKNHRFIPVGNGYLDISETSEDNATLKRVKITNFQDGSIETMPNLENNPIPLESYVVVEEGSKRWVGFVDFQDNEFGDYHIKFLHPAGIKAFYHFPDNEREHCFKSREHIIGVLSTPKLKPGSRIQYSFLKNESSTLMKQK